MLLSSQRKQRHVPSLKKSFDLSENENEDKEDNNDDTRAPIEGNINQKRWRCLLGKK
jgi:hypothetical protein